jgi:hypothetical protein
MTKIDGRRLYDQNVGHWLFGLSTSDPTWQILRGNSMTKSNGRGSKSAQSSLPSTWAKPKKLSLFFSSSRPFRRRFFLGHWRFTMATGVLLF